jgi:hypothetical protein
MAKGFEHRVAKLERRTPTPASLDLSRMTEEESTAAMLEGLRQILADPRSSPEELRHASGRTASPPWRARCRTGRCVLGKSQSGRRLVRAGIIGVPPSSGIGKKKRTISTMSSRPAYCLDRRLKCQLQTKVKGQLICQ